MEKIKFLTLSGLELLQPGRSARSKSLYRLRYPGSSKHRWEDNIKIDLREIGWEDVDWIHLAQNRDQWRALVNTVLEVAEQLLA
jgi:hypothetical protein